MPLIRRKRRTRLVQVLSRPLREGAFEHHREGSAVTLYHSRFNDRWLAELDIAPHVILDIGSYDGGDAIRLRNAFPDSRIVAVEADPNRFSIVEANVGGSRVETCQFAILDRDGPVDWYPAINSRIGTVDAQGSIYRQSAEQDAAFPFIRQSERPVTVAGHRLDTLCAALGITGIDLLHMDIQGAEHAALVGLGELRPKAIYLEWQSERHGWKGSADSAATSALLREMKYELAADIRSDRFYVKREFARYRGALGAIRRRIAPLRRDNTRA